MVFKNGDKVIFSTHKRPGDRREGIYIGEFGSHAAIYDPGCKLMVIVQTCHILGYAEPRSFTPQDLKCQSTLKALEAEASKEKETGDYGHFPTSITHHALWDAYKVAVLPADTQTPGWCVFDGKCGRYVWEGGRTAPTAMVLSSWVEAYEMACYYVNLMHNENFIRSAVRTGQRLLNDHELFVTYDICVLPDLSNVDESKWYIRLPGRAGDLYLNVVGCFTKAPTLMCHDDANRGANSFVAAGGSFLSADLLKKT